MGHIDEGDLQLLLVAADLHLHLRPELAIEIGERLVEQQQGGPRDQAAGKGHALLLAARELVGIAAFQPLQPQQRHHPLQLLVAPGLGRILHAQGKDDVLRDGLMGEEQEVLEHHADVAAIGRQIGDVLSADQHAAFVGELQPGDDAQQGRLARTAGTQQGEELALLDLQIGPVDRGHRAEAPGHGLKLKRRAWHSVPRRQIKERNCLQSAASN